jgi:hypothetical protein
MLAQRNFPHLDGCEEATFVDRDSWSGSRLPESHCNGICKHAKYGPNARRKKQSITAISKTQAHARMVLRVSAKL